jgi:hypothetical protein
MAGEEDTADISLGFADTDPAEAGAWLAKYDEECEDIALDIKAIVIKNEK